MKTHEMFFVHTTRKKFEHATITGNSFGFVFRENSERKSNGYRNIIVFEKFRF